MTISQLGFGQNLPESTARYVKSPIICSLCTFHVPRFTDSSRRNVVYRENWTVYQVILSDLVPMSENSKTQLPYNVTDFLLYGSSENNHCDAFDLNVQDDISFSSGWNRR